MFGRYQRSPSRVNEARALRELKSLRSLFARRRSSAFHRLRSISGGENGFDFGVEVLKKGFKYGILEHVGLPLGNRCPVPVGMSFTRGMSVFYQISL
jgi:hypothetical protein